MKFVSAYCIETL